MLVLCDCGCTCFTFPSPLHVASQKPENIGFDIRGDIKLFDFGLAKELDPSKINSKGMYKLTPKTGTPRYMAPEVTLGRPYGLAADVYSFAVLLWEMLSLSKPFASFNEKMLADLVARRDIRPEIDPSWPDSLRILLRRGWSARAADRLSMSSVTKILRKDVVSLRNGNEAGLTHHRRRSTFVLRRSGSVPSPSSMRPLFKGSGRMKNQVS